MTENISFASPRVMKGSGWPTGSGGSGVLGLAGCCRGARSFSFSSVKEEEGLGVVGAGVTGVEEEGLVFVEGVKAELDVSFGTV